MIHYAFFIYQSSAHANIKVDRAELTVKIKEKAWMRMNDLQFICSWHLIFYPHQNYMNTMKLRLPVMYLKSRTFIHTINTHSYFYKDRIHVMVVIKIQHWKCCIFLLQYCTDNNCPQHYDQLPNSKWQI